MRKINNKGVSLIELIVSFAIVGVAIIYFFQTLYTVKKVYLTARDETNEFVAKDYVLRLLDKYIDEKGTTTGFCGKIINCTLNNENTDNVINSDNDNAINTYKIEDIEYGNGKITSVTLYKYIPTSTSETSNE